MPPTTTLDLLRELAELHRRAAELEARAGLRPGEGKPEAVAAGPDELAGGLHEAVAGLSDEPVAVLSLSGDFLHLNRAAETLLGQRADGLLGQNLWALVHQEDAPGLAAAQALPRSGGLPLACRLRTVGGAYAELELRVEPWPSENPRRLVTRWRSRTGPGAGEAGRDAARLRRAAALARLGWLALGLPEPIDVVAAAVALVPSGLGLPAAAFLAPADAGLRVRAEMGFPPGTRDRSVPLLRTLAGQVWAGGTAQRLGDLARERTLADPLLEGERFGSAAAVPVRSRERAHGVLLVAGPGPRHLDDEELQFLEAAADEVAAALEGGAARERLGARDRLARTAFEQSREGLLLVDGEGRVVEANAAAAQTLGLSPRALRGRRPAEVVETELDLTPFAPGGSRTREAVVQGPLGPRTVEAELVATDRPADVALAALRDVTERKEMLSRLALADRLISAGTLAGGVAHELKTPLAYVTSNLQYLAEAFREGSAAGRPEVAEALHDALEGTSRLKRIVDDLRTFVRTPGMDRGPADLEAVLRSCVGMTWGEIQPRARLERSLEPVPAVVGNAARLAQVFVNLLVNASQAIPAGASHRHVIQLVTRRRGSDRVVVEVSDSGSGISPAVLPHIFEPFFTTKGPGVGTGLGLSICRNIVEGLGGAIEVESEPGRGSTFRVVLPVAAAAAEEATALARSRILVVEEALEAGDRLRAVLGEEHEVTVASPSQARDRLAHGERFDAVLAELDPRRAMVDLQAELVRHDPGLAGRVVLVRGAAGAAGAGEGEAGTPAEDLRVELSRVLASARPGSGEGPGRPS